MSDQTPKETVIDPQWKVSSEEASKSMLQEYLHGNNDHAKLRLNLNSEDGLYHSTTSNQKIVLRPITEENETKDKLLQTIGVKSTPHPNPGLYLEFTLRHPSALDSYDKHDPSDLNSVNQYPTDHAVIPTQQLINQHNKNYPQLTLRKVF
jgi:hypothetical protein